MKALFDKLWYDMVFLKAVILALLVGAGAFYAMPNKRPVMERLVNAALFTFGTAGAALSSSSGTRPTNGGTKP